MIKEKFIGSWKLKSIIVTHNKHKIYPFGKHVKGFLVYLPNDHMSVQIMMPRHYPVTDQEKLTFNLEELAQTLKAAGYLAYYGIAQPVVGEREIRHYKFVDDPMGQKLILSKGNMELLWVKD